MPARKAANAEPAARVKAKLEKPVDAEPETQVPAAPEKPARARRKAAPAADARGRVRVTLVRSTIGHRAGARGTVRALGLHRLHQTVEIADTPENRGMLRRIAFLIDVAEPADATPSGGDQT